MGVKLPIFKEGDDISEKIVSELIENYDLDDTDVIGITESIVARAQGNYATVDEIADEIRRIYGDSQEIMLMNPIYSRNRFAMILKGIARATSRLIIVMPEFDEVGNPKGVNPFTGVDIEKYYSDICKEENCEVHIANGIYSLADGGIDVSGCNNILYCGLHKFEQYKEKFDAQQNERIQQQIAGGYSPDEFINVHTLADICRDKCEYGLLGSNKASEERVKLFPNKQKAECLCYDIKCKILERTNKDVIVCVYGDGCFKDPVGEIWEFADPVTMPAYTDEELLESTPNEVKVKALADDKFANLSGEELQKSIEKEIENKSNDLKGNMASQGTTPRMYRDLLASLMDLTSGSGDRCTPVVLIKNYF